MTEITSTMPVTRPGVRDVLRLPVRLWLVVMFMAVGFAGGFLVRGLAERPAQPIPAVSVPAPGSDAGQVAPALTDDQLKAGLPPGHPDVGGAADTTPTTDPAPTTTGP